MRRRTVLLGLGGLLVARTGQAHPYHVASAEARLRDGKLEVALEVSPRDLEEALGRLAGKDVDIDHEDAVPLVRKYLRERFIVRGPDGPVALAWVGSEIELESAWLYFEYETPGAARDYSLYCGVFFDIAPAQVNRVLVRRGKTKRTLRFRSGDPARPLA